MSNYVKATNFASKDSLPTGDANKIVKGTEIDNEFNAISGAISSKADIASPTFTGAPAAPTATAGSNTTQLANTAFVKAEITALSLGNMSTQAKSAVDITGGTIVGITDLAVADGGTGASTLAANAVLLGNGTSAIQTVAPGSSANLLTSNGTTWTSTTPAYVGARGQVFTSTGTFTVPAGVTAVKVTVIGGGGNGGSTSGGTGVVGAGGGGGGGIAIKYVTGLTSGDTVTATVGGAGGTSSFGAFVSATGGATGGGTGAAGAGGSGSSGDLNISGGAGGVGVAGDTPTAGAGGSAGGGTATNTIPAGSGYGRGGLPADYLNGFAGVGYGSGGGGGLVQATIPGGGAGFGSGGAGTAGVVIVEF